VTVPPPIDRLHRLIPDLAGRATPKNPLDKAIHQWPTQIVFLDDPRLPLSIAPLERQQRRMTVRAAARDATRRAALAGERHDLAGTGSPRVAVDTHHSCARSSLAAASVAVHHRQWNRRTDHLSPGAPPLLSSRLAVSAEPAASNLDRRALQERPATCAASARVTASDARQRDAGPIPLRLRTCPCCPWPLG
jgi:hypothetical protein